MMTVISPKSWIAGNLNSLGAKKLSALMLPGTHNSGAYTVDFTQNVWLNPWSGLVNLIGRFTPIGRVISEWTVTQQYNIKEQLEHGVRALDLRVSYNPTNTDNPFYISHTFACVPVTDVLQQIKSFLQANPQEIIVISMKPDFDNQDNMLGHDQELLNQIMTALNELLCTARSSYTDDSLQINSMLDRNERIVFFYPGTNNEKIWPANLYKEIWLNKTTTADWEQELDNIKVNLFNNQNICNSISVILTPDYDYIKNNFWRQFVFAPSQALAYLATQMQSLVPKISTDPELATANIIYTDFIADDTVEQLVTHNIQNMQNIELDNQNIPDNNNQATMIFSKVYGSVGTNIFAFPNDDQQKSVVLNKFR